MAYEWEEEEEKSLLECFCQQFRKESINDVYVQFYLYFLLYFIIPYQNEIASALVSYSLEILRHCRLLCSLCWWHKHRLYTAAKILQCLEIDITVRTFLVRICSLEIEKANRWYGNSAVHPGMVAMLVCLWATVPFFPLITAIMCCCETGSLLVNTIIHNSASHVRQLTGFWETTLVIYTLRSGQSSCVSDYKWSSLMCYSQSACYFFWT